MTKARIAAALALAATLLTVATLVRRKTKLHRALVSDPFVDRVESKLMPVLMPHAVMTPKVAAMKSIHCPSQMVKDAEKLAAQAPAGHSYIHEQTAEDFNGTARSIRLEADELRRKAAVIPKAKYLLAATISVGILDFTKSIQEQNAEVARLYVAALHDGYCPPHALFLKTPPDRGVDTKLSGEIKQALQQAAGKCAVVALQLSDLLRDELYDQFDTPNSVAPSSASVAQQSAKIVQLACQAADLGSLEAAHNCGEYLSGEDPRVLVPAKNLDRAEKYYLAAAALEPNSGMPAYRLARISATKNDRKNAAIWYCKSMFHGADSPDPDLGKLVKGDN